MIVENTSDNMILKISLEEIMNMRKGHTIYHEITRYKIIISLERVYK